jgi:predicted Zn-dependent protease
VKTLLTILTLTIMFANFAEADTVEVATGVRVTKKVYSVPENEQPFFGFVEKTSPQIAADEKFTAAIIQALGSRQKALDETLKRGWSAFQSGDLGMAGRRFNQAYLISSEQSGVYHAFAALLQVRFNDTEYADELFHAALKQPNPNATLRADYGRFLLMAKRPADALPLLEQAVIDAPKFGNAWSNLAFARLQTGDRQGACTAAGEAEKLANASNVRSDVDLLKREAKC